MLFLWLSLFAIALAQIPSIPACAQPCLLAAFGSQICNLTDTNCICTNQEFQANVATCLIASSCTIPELLDVKNMSVTTCGAPLHNSGRQADLFTYITFITVFVFVIIRFTYKLLLARVDLGYDDWCVLVTSITFLASFLVAVCGVIEHGLGQDTWTLHPDEITLFMKYTHIAGVLYFLETALLKLCFLFFYLRVFAGIGVQRILWSTVALVAVWGTVFVLIALFRCRPISYAWESWDGLHDGSCIVGIVFTIVHAVINIAFDIWMLAIPWWQIKGLNMHWRKKLKVMLMFIVGTFVTVVSILRLRAIVKVSISENPTRELYDAYLWSKLEIGVGIMGTCLPTLRQILLHLFPSLSGTTARNRGYYFNHEENHQHKKFNRQHQSQGTTGLTNSTVFSTRTTNTHRSTLKEDGEAQEGILMTNLSPDQHGNSQVDEISQESHAEDRPQSHQSIM